MIAKRYLTGGINATTFAYNNTTPVVGNTTAYDRVGNKFYERALQAEERDNLYQPVNSNGNIASPIPGYDSINRLLQYQRGTLNSTGGYQLAGGGSVTTAITLPNTDQSRSYTLDGLGNWRATGFTPVGGSQTTDQRNHNYVNEITQRTVGTGSQVVFQYDGKSGASNGNLAKDGTLIYAYDALNRLIQVNRVSDGLVIGAYVYDAMNRRVRKTITNGGLSGNILDGTTDYIWLGSQVMEERNPFGGSGSTDTPIKQYIWGTYIDECIQLTTLVTLGAQNLSPGTYYLCQDLLHRAVALTDSSGTVVEAYDCDAYGNTLIFTAPDSSSNWWSDAAVQSNYGANEIIYCGYRHDSESGLYYVRNRTYNPVLGRWIQRDPIGYAGGINLYEYVLARPTIGQDPQGLQSGFNPWTQPSFHWRFGRHSVNVIVGFVAELTILDRELAGIGIEGSVGVSKVQTSIPRNKCRNEWIIPPNISHSLFLIPGGLIATTNTDFGVFSVNLMAGVWIGGILVSIYEGVQVTGSYLSWSKQECACIRFDFEGTLSGQATLNRWALAGALVGVAAAMFPEVVIASALAAAEQEALLVIALISQGLSDLGAKVPAPL